MQGLVQEDGASETGNSGKPEMLKWALHTDNSGGIFNKIGFLQNCNVAYSKEATGWRRGGS